jgi:hypothetical protein
MIPKRKLPDDPHPEAEERFNRLLKVMTAEPEAATACDRPLGGNATSDHPVVEIDETAKPGTTLEDVKRVLAVVNATEGADIADFRGTVE